MSAPTIRTNGSVVRLRWAEHEIFCTLDRFKDSGGVSKAELSAYLDGETPRLLTQGQLNLTSMQGRASFAKRLTELHPGTPWNTVVENLAVHGLQFSRQGEPIVPLEPVDSIHVPFDVNPLIYKNHQTLMFAQGGSLKSYLGLLVALLVSNGQACAGLSAVQGKVLYLDWELDRQTMGGREKALQAGHPTLSAIPFYRRCEAPLHQDAHHIAAYVAEKGIGLVIIDSAAMACGGDLSNPDSAIGLQRALRQIGCSSLVLAHTSKSIQEGQEKTAYGTVFFRELARNVWELQRAEGDHPVRVALHQKKNNFGSIHPPMGFEFNFLPNAVQVQACNPEDEPEFEDRLPVPSRIRNLLEDGTPRAAREIADELKLKLVTVKSTLSRGQGYKWMMLGGSGQETTWTVLRPK